MQGQVGGALSSDEDVEEELHERDDHRTDDHAPVVGCTADDEGRPDEEGGAGRGHETGLEPTKFPRPQGPSQRGDGATDGEAHRLVPHDVVTVVLSDVLVFTDGPQHAPPRRAVQGREDEPGQRCGSDAEQGQDQHVGGRLREAQPLTDDGSGTRDGWIQRAGHGRHDLACRGELGFTPAEPPHVERFRVLPNADGRGVRTDPEQRFTAQQEPNDLTHRDGDDGEVIAAQARRWAGHQPSRGRADDHRRQHGREDRPIVAEVFLRRRQDADEDGTDAGEEDHTEVQQAGHSGVEVQGEGEQEENREGGQDVADLQRLVEAPIVASVQRQPEDDEEEDGRKQEEGAC